MATATNRTPKLRHLYVRLGYLLARRLPKLYRNTPRKLAMQRVREMLEDEFGYRFEDVDIDRPWGGYFRIADEQLDKFLVDFFPGLSEEEARLDIPGAEVSPKIMVFMPGQRISWQYHERRTERWHFLTPGTYYRSYGDVLPPAIHARAGEVVQFGIPERHRGGAPSDKYVLVAEIWQHTDPKHLSDESDIIRIADDYNRPARPDKM